MLGGNAAGKHTVGGDAFTAATSAVSSSAEALGESSTEALSMTMWRGAAF